MGHPGAHRQAVPASLGRVDGLAALAGSARAVAAAGTLKSVDAQICQTGVWPEKAIAHRGRVDFLGFCVSPMQIDAWRLSASGTFNMWASVTKTAPNRYRGETNAARGDCMRTYAKKNFPVTKVRRFLEPGPVVLVSSSYKDERDIMTMGWHMVMGDSPSLVGCYIWDRNYSFSLIRGSKECVINVPTFEMIAAVIGIGNCHGPDPDKFEKFRLRRAASKVQAPLMRVPLVL